LFCAQVVRHGVVVRRFRNVGVVVGDVDSGAVDGCGNLQCARRRHDVDGCGAGGVDGRGSPAPGVPAAGVRRAVDDGGAGGVDERGSPGPGVPVAGVVPP
jgi:hypothetical protein